MKTKGIKMDDDLISRFNSMYDSFKTAGMVESETQFAERLLDEMDKSKLTGEMSYGSHLKELNQLTNRISEVFVNMAKQNETDRISIERTHAAEMEKKNGQLDKQKEMLENLKIDLQEKNGTLVELEEQQTRTNEELTSLKERIQDQTKIITGQEEQMKTNMETISNQAQKIDSMTRAISQNEELILSVRNLQEDLTDLQESHEKTLQQREFEFKNELFEKEKELQRGFQDKLEKVQDHMNDKYEERLAGIMEKNDNRINTLIAELSSAKAKNEQHEATEKSLLDKIQQLEKELSNSKGKK